MKTILIAGPTASGKSALALALAERLGGIVVNTDSMQVYRDLRIITARPRVEDEARVPHLLYGHVDANVNYSVGRFVADARAALAVAAQRRLVPIFTGGSGLYFKALICGLAAVPPVPDDIREAVRARLAAQGPAALHVELERHDPAAAVRLSPNDRARIARALEVVLATGRPLADWHREGLPPLIDSDEAVKLFLAPERAELYRRIDTRFEAMMAEGALAEVEALAARNLDPLLPAMKAHGVPGLIRHLNGEMTREEAAARARADTRHYAKRQFTWFRHQLGDWPQPSPGAALDHVLDRVAASA